MPTLYIIRGVPGSGKTTLAYRLTDTVIEADDFFVDPDGVYRYDQKRIGEAHAHCQIRVLRAMAYGINRIAVSNTFTRCWELITYIEMAKALGYAVRVIRCQGTWQNTHGVPAEIVEAMRNRFEDWPGEEPAETILAGH